MRRLALVALLCLVALPAWGGVEFDNASDEYYNLNTLFVPGDRPFSISAWVYVPTGASNGTVVASGDSGDNSSSFIVYVLPTVSNTVRFYVSESTATTADAGTTFPNDEWFLVVVVDVSATDHRAYMNGSASEGTSSTSRTPVGINNSRIGNEAGATPGTPMDGWVAHLAIWEGHQLTASEIDALAAGKAPITVRPDKLAHYFPMLGDGPVGTRVRDVVGGGSVSSVNGTPAKAPSPPIRPFGPFYSTRLNPHRLLDTPLNIRRCREEDYA